MAKRLIIAALIVWCVCQTPAVHAQWGLSGQEADPRYNEEGGAATLTQDNIPGIDIRGGYLSWWLRDPKLRGPLVTTGGGSGIPGTPGTSVLIGPDSIQYNSPFSGGELAARFWADSTQTGSFEVGGFILGRRSSTILAASSPTQPNLFVPGVTPAGVPIALQIAGPGTSGGVLASANSFLWGGDANLVVNTLTALELFGGGRYIDLAEDIDITGQNQVGRTINRNSDHFHTRNQFYGGQAGARGVFRYGLLTAVIEGKVAIGDNHESILVAGSSTVAVAGPSTTTPVGLLANNSNSGRYVRDQFAVVPQAGGRIGIDIADGAQAFIGYDFLYISHVVRPGDQIVVSLPRAGATATVPFSDTYFWAHGITVGLEVRY